MSQIPTLLELAENKLSYAGPRDRTINIKVSIGTARMMVEAERKARAGLRAMLERLTEKVERANGIQHSGGPIEAEDWAELYQITNEARGLLAKTEG